MAVVGIAEELPNSPESGGLELGKFVFRRHFRVIVSSYADGPITVCSAIGIPPLFASYITANELYVYARVRRYENVERIGPNQLVWRVTAVYETPERRSGSNHGAGGGTGRENPQENSNPLVELPTAKITFTEHEEPVTQVYDLSSGLVIAPGSSAQEPFDPPPKAQNRFMRLEISRNEPLDNRYPAAAIYFQNKVNSDYFWGQAPGTCRCVNIAPERMNRQILGQAIVSYMHVVYSFEFRDDWDVYPLDFGSWYYGQNPSAVAANTRFQKLQFTGTDGHPTNGLLNGQGGALPDPSTFSISSNTITANITGSQNGALTRRGVYINGLAVKFIPLNGASLPGGITLNTVYYTISVNSAGTAFSVSLTPGGSAVTLSGGMSGVVMVQPQPVYGRLRKYNRVAFALMNLPQSFLQVQ